MTMARTPIQGGPTRYPDFTHLTWSIWMSAPVNICSALMVSPFLPITLPTCGVLCVACTYLRAKCITMQTHTQHKQHSGRQGGEAGKTGGCAQNKPHY